MICDGKKGRKRQAARNCRLSFASGGAAEGCGREWELHGLPRGGVCFAQEAGERFGRFFLRGGMVVL